MAGLPEKRGNAPLVIGGASAATLVVAQAFVNSIVSDVMLAVCVGGVAFAAGFLKGRASDGK